MALRIRRLVQRLPLSGAVFLAALSLTITAILALPLPGLRPPLSAGDLAPRTLKSPREVAPFVSDALTTARRQQAVDAVEPVLRYDPAVGVEQSAALAGALRQISVIRDSGRLTPEQRVQALRQVGAVTLAPERAATLLALDADAWQATAAEAQGVFQQLAWLRFTAAETPVVRAQLGALARPGLTADQQRLIGDLLDDLVRPTLSPDPAATERARRAAAANVEPVTVALARGETVIRDGEVITPAALEKLQAAGLTAGGLRPRELAGAGLLSLAMSALLLLFLARQQPDAAGAPLRPTPRRLLLLGAVIAGTTAAAKVLLPQYPEWAFAFPLAAGPILLAVLMDGSLALLAAALLALLAAIAADFAPEAGGFVASSPLTLLERVAFFFLSSVAGVLAALRAQRLPQFFLAGAAVSGAGLLTVVSFWLLAPEPGAPSLAMAAAATLGNGALAATLAVAAFVAAGQLFGVTTSIQLAELAQSQHPLMRRLIAEAPGTYYHSLLVGNLAERAAEAVGADALLARVGAYYHDIGKLANPGVFIENHRTPDSPHDHLDPHRSAALITAHVADGLRLAQEHRLPARIRDFIAMHHGTRMAVFFYDKAQQQRGPGEPPPDPHDFSYAGPRPRSKETALVMLADSLEAATRSLGRPSAQDIDELVDSLVAERVAEGQLDDSDLTLRDLEHAKAAFKEALQGIFHPRIAYPRGVPGTAAAAGSGGAPVEPLPFTRSRRRGRGRE